ncbi:hypothetical protein [Streptomyces sp. NPDC001770]
MRERVLSARGEGPAEVAAAANRPEGPSRTAITHEGLRDSVGVPVAADRGAGYVPRPSVTDPVCEEFAVARFGRPEPFREPGRMPAGVRLWRRWKRQALPRGGARTCRWCHGGDWHTVSAMAFEVLRRARAQGVEADAGRTVVLITHRLAPRSADGITAFDGG